MVFGQNLKIMTSAKKDTIGKSISRGAEWQSSEQRVMSSLGLPFCGGGGGGAKRLGTVHLLPRGLQAKSLQTERYNPQTVYVMSYHYVPYDMHAKVYMTRPTGILQGSQVTSSFHTPQPMLSS